MRNWKPVGGQKHMYVININLITCTCKNKQTNKQQQRKFDYKFEEHTEMFPRYTYFYMN